jgi:type II secretory pathway component PulJ
MTLVEMMVAVGVGSLIFVVLAVTFMTCARSFASMGNYVDMDTSSRTAMDQMSRDIRQTASVTEFTSSHLKFALAGQANAFLVYDWDPVAGQLTQWETGFANTNVLLTGCHQLTFSLYNAAFQPTTDPSKGKGLCVNWECSRTVLGNTNTTEDIQQAMIVLRN